MRQYHRYLVLLCTRHSSYTTFYFFSAVNSFSFSSNDDSESDMEHQASFSSVH